MRKNIEPRKNKKGEVVDGLHEIGQVAVGSGQICLADPCYITKGEEPDITITTNFGDGMFAQLLKPVLAKVNYSVSIEDIRNNKQKELRIIDTLEPVLNSHKLVVDPRVIKSDYESYGESGIGENLNYLLFYQLSRITRDRGSLRHDDRLDALSMAVGYWVEHMSRSQDEAIRDIRATRIQRELDRFSEGVFGGKPKENLWVKL